MVARKISKKEAEGGLKFSRAQTEKIVENMLLSEGDKNERAMMNPRTPMPGEEPGTVIRLKPNRKGERRGGRQKGTPNKLPTIVKEGMVEAATRIGFDGKGAGGLVGFFMRAYLRDPIKGAGDLTKIIPHQHIAKQFNFASLVNMTPDQVVANMKERGLPVEQLRFFDMMGSSIGKEVGPSSRPKRLAAPIEVEYEEVKDE